ncbi:hypothetical protein GCM10025857_16050 [Alicyclobacillus contaminans]|uniref:hypothetical protein n=1 Tax=Alicyclobacillus contaminans TaxID=392016 RepID=UPI00040B7024|nr:hypothetical protein [Alicyclobacillus contaminans]GMA50248.1 hypothetical protein GCM10025857_16050 [Alicyclobacillus contaminans]
MWEFMNGMAAGVRRRIMPRRRNGMGTMTAMLVGASVGIAAWETMRRSRMVSTGNHVDANQIADDMLESLKE